MHQRMAHFTGGEMYHMAEAWESASLMRVASWMFH